MLRAQMGQVNRGWGSWNRGFETATWAQQVRRTASAVPHTPATPSPNGKILWLSSRSLAGLWRRK